MCVCVWVGGVGGEGGCVWVKLKSKVNFALEQIMKAQRVVEV
jgi:hypothetical protein